MRNFFRIDDDNTDNSGYGFSEDTDKRKYKVVKKYPLVAEIHLALVESHSSRVKLYFAYCVIKIPIIFKQKTALNQQGSAISHQ